jgi:hypothetical protein
MKYMPLRAKYMPLRVWVDEYAAMHNNTTMHRASLVPVILLNTVRSTGATG